MKPTTQIEHVTNSTVFLISTLLKKINYTTTTTVHFRRHYIDRPTCDVDVQDAGCVPPSDSTCFSMSTRN